MFAKIDLRKIQTVARIMTVLSQKLTLKVDLKTKIIEMRNVFYKL